MIKYAKVVDEISGICQIGVGTDTNFYKSIGMAELDVEQSQKDGEWYLSEKCPHFSEDDVLNKLKLIKIKENEEKRNVSFIETSLGRLKTETPLGDLKTALPLYEKIVKANNCLPENSVRVYDAEGNVRGNTLLSVDEFDAVITEIALRYLAIDAKSTQYTIAISQAESLESLNAIDIQY